MGTTRGLNFDQGLLLERTHSVIPGGVEWGCRHISRTFFILAINLPTILAISLGCICMKRKAFVPPRRLQTAEVAGHAGQQVPQAPKAGSGTISVFDCLYMRRMSSARGAGTKDGTLVLQGSRALVFDLDLHEAAQAVLPRNTAVNLHKAHAAAVTALAAGQPMGQLWTDQQCEMAETLQIGRVAVIIADDRSSAIPEAEWTLRQRVATEIKAGKPANTGQVIPPDNIGWLQWHKA
jgi:hypothetical protein